MMMKLLTVVFLSCVLMACGQFKTGDSQYQYTPVKQCQTQCGERLVRCNGLCVNTFPKCRTKGRRMAAKDYTDYIHQQRVAGKPVNRELNSYYDPLQCTKTTCNCQADVRACYKLCELKD